MSKLKQKISELEYFICLILFNLKYTNLSVIKHEEELEFSNIDLVDDEDLYINNENETVNKSVTRRRTLRSHRSSDSSSNGTSDGSASKAGSSRFENKSDILQSIYKI